MNKILKIVVRGEGIETQPLVAAITLTATVSRKASMTCVH